eukprot:7319607-Pyramimonas_sp.AAC.1
MSSARVREISQPGICVNTARPRVTNLYMALEKTFCLQNLCGNSSCACSPWLPILRQMRAQPAGGAGGVGGEKRKRNREW